MDARVDFRCVCEDAPSFLGVTSLGYLDQRSSGSPTLVSIPRYHEAMSERDDLQQMLRALHAEASERVEQLNATLEELTHSRRSESDDDEHDPEGVTLSSEWSRLSGLLEGADHHLRDVEAALERWEAGTYGVCDACGSEIPDVRREARPFANQCVPCAERSGH